LEPQETRDSTDGGLQMRSRSASMISSFSSSSVATLPPNYSNLSSRSTSIASFSTCEINLILNFIFSRIVEQDLNAIFFAVPSHYDYANTNTILQSDKIINRFCKYLYISLRNCRDKHPTIFPVALISQ